jgi:transcriptional regulator with XRE-family HTH domain
MPTKKKQPPTTRPQTDAEWLKQARATMDLSQSQLARGLAISASLVRAIEQGSRTAQPRLRAQVEALPLKLADELRANAEHESTLGYLTSAGLRAVVCHVPPALVEKAKDESRRRSSPGYVSPAHVIGEWAEAGSTLSVKSGVK